MKSSIVLRAAYLVFGTGEVIEPDVPVAGAGQLANRFDKDSKLLHSLGQVTLEASLLFFHPRHMRIAEHGDAIRLHVDDLADCVAEAPRGLVRKPVDQVDV